MSDLSFSKIMLLFYIFTTSSALFPLLSKQLKNLLENDRIAQHTVGVTTLLSIIILLSNGELSINKTVIYSLLGYILFVLSTKMDIQFVIIIISSLVMLSLYQNTIQNENNLLLKDDNLTNEEKKNIIKDKEKKIFLYLIGILITIIIGTTLYSNKKEGQYGGGYDLMNFLIY